MMEKYWGLWDLSERSLNLSSPTVCVSLRVMMDNYILRASVESVPFRGGNKTFPERNGYSVIAPRVRKCGFVTQPLGRVRRSISLCFSLLDLNSERPS